MKVWRTVSRVGAALLSVALLASLPVLGVETACRQPARGMGTDQAAPPWVADAGYSRPETNSYLSYPEWYIVYAYQDFAGVLRRHDESGFDYLASIGGFWTSLCGVNRIASAQGGGELDEKAMLYVIGVSFTAEMAIKGAYETTLGRISAWSRGPERTNEDVFALHVAEDYAQFLQQTPWYDYPFMGRLRQFWRDVPFTSASPGRAAERRFALTLEWGAKAAYAGVIRVAAGLSPAELRIGSLVQGMDASDAVADPRIDIVRDLGGGLSLIETPRYGAFTDIVAGLAARGRQVVEIAGNRSVLATALLPPDTSAALDGARVVFTEGIQSRPGWRRLGLDVAVPHLSELIRQLQSRGALFEHVYDY